MAENKTRHLPANAALAQAKFVRMTPMKCRRVIDLVRGMDVQPALGRAFTAEEEASNAKVVLLNDGYWRSRFGAAPDTVGGTLTKPGDGQYTIPHCTDMKQMQTPEMQKKLEEGPTGFVVVRGPGKPGMGKPGCRPRAAGRRLVPGRLQRVTSSLLRGGRSIRCN